MIAKGLWRCVAVPDWLAGKSRIDVG